MLRGCFPLVHFVTYVTYQTAEQLFSSYIGMCKLFLKEQGVFIHVVISSIFMLLQMDYKIDQQTK